jgi:AcrR family transcriptional regulator
MTAEPGLRARKKLQTRQAISTAALRLFYARGFESVTMAEVAGAAGVARMTLFNYFPTKEALVLDPAAMDDPSAVVRQRPAGVTVVAALRAHCLAFAADPGITDGAALIRYMRLIFDSPSLTAGLNRIFDEQRERLAATLAAETVPAENVAAENVAAEPDRAADDLTHTIAAAQICAVVNTLRADFYRRAAGGQPLDRVLTRLAADTTIGFDLLERGIGDLYPQSPSDAGK